MNYKFPVITHIDQVLPYVKDHPSFVVVEKDGYTVINYIMMGNDTFPDIIDYDENNPEHYKSAILRECRGLIFCSYSGKILRRAYHKFFNLGEKEELHPDRINWNTKYEIDEKLDGSMITPIKLGDNIRWTTKMGITDIAMDVEVFIEKNLKFKQFADYCSAANITPIFEWCSRSNKVVIDHPEDKLILTSLRNTYSGTYWNKEHTKTIALIADIPVVTNYDTKLDIHAFVDELKTQEGIEGIVLNFESGHKVKVKTEWYVQIHRAKENLNHEKRVIELIQSGNVDDVLPFLMEDDRKRLSDYVENFQRGKFAVAVAITKLLAKYAGLKLDRKTFSLDYSKHNEPNYNAVIWKFWDNKDATIVEILEYIDKIINKNLSSQTTVDKARSLWYNYSWNNEMDIQ
jgi:T4 RnlA family RNA ligase